MLIGFYLNINDDDEFEFKFKLDLLKKGSFTLC